MNTLRKILPYVLPYRLRFIQASIAMVVVAAFNGATIYLLKPIIDEVFINKDFEMLPLVIICVPLLMAIKSTAAYLQNYLMSWIGQRVTQELREDLFRHLHTLSLGYFSEQKSGEILARVTNDLNNVQSALQFMPLYMVRDTLTVIILMGVLFTLNWRFALLAFCAMPIASILIVILGKKMRAASLQSQVIMGQIYHRFQESLQGMMLIKAFNYEKGAIAKFQEENTSFFEQMMRYLRATALSGPLMEFVGSLIVALILYLGGREVISERMSPGGFLAFLGAFFAAYMPTKNLARMNSELQRGISSGDRIFQLLDEKPSVTDRRDAASFTSLAREIQFKNISFHYPKRELPALEGVDITVPRGKTVAVVGPSGSGKSTLVQLLLRLYDPDGGAILFDGTDLRDFKIQSVRERFGLVTQETMLFNDSVYENIAIGRPLVTREDVERAAGIANAHDFITRLPQGYDTPLGERGLRLSGGQRQRLAIARAVLTNPELLVLDEATSNLDSTSEAEVQRAMEKLMQGRTVILIAHRLSTVHGADTIYVLNHGRVAECGNHGQLLRRDGIYRKLYALQQSEPAAAEELAG